MSDIFISYSRKDEQFVSRLVSDLENAHWDVYYDRKVKAGQDWGIELAKGLQKATYFVVVLSRNSLASGNVQLEVKTALELEKKHQWLTVIPIRIEPCDEEETFKLIGRTQYVDFFEKYRTGFKELSSTLGESRSKVNGGGRKMPTRKQGTIIAAVIGGIVTLGVAYMQFVYKPSPPPPDPGPIQYAGRVSDLASQEVIHGAKVSVDTPVAPPQVYYTDSNGVFYLKLPTSAGGAAHIRVEANGYETFDLNVALSRTGIEEVRLTARANKDSSESNRNSGSSHGTSREKENTNSQKKIDRILKSASVNKPN